MNVLVRPGYEQPNKAAIAFWGSSINTYWDTDDIIEKRMFDAWWYDNLERIGQMTNKGMYDSYMEYGSGMTPFINCYNVLGDASVKIWRDNTGNFDVYQGTFDRGFPVRHALDGDWAAGQSFMPSFDTLTGVDIYLRKSGTPDLTLPLNSGKRALRDCFSTRSYLMLPRLKVLGNG